MPDKKSILTTKSRLIRLREVQSRIGLGKSSIYSLASKGLFPSSVKIGPRARGWLESEVEDWINKRITDSRVNKEIS